ncbi:Ubiquinol--cytochrome c reductase, cytochrome B subunit [Rhodovulum sp. P5]|uniref:DUF1924 domain-containing protein n=1 Tax=Rhodovulum sp. P5 TaxID=1564506 RepID=UPI0009C3D40D|nr:DUF1924 domain-containing protein [Rhodovulum sp. P5]ARE39717.1 Ubiquinol--cytochrome c reductase, cytochrome B subunit [Rhodovulum sp. P5]
MKRLTLCLAMLAAAPALAQDTSPARLIAGYEAEAGTPANPAAGKALFLATHGTGKPDTPACTTCHTDNPRAAGQTRTGKTIDPLAPSANPDRFTDVKKVEKWFGRNCDSVLGRACTAAEKADIIAWLSGL